ncbi:hypothetical protein ACCS70_27165 [Rhizobium ruizarguesonis]
MVRQRALWQSIGFGHGLLPQTQHMLQVMAHCAEPLLQNAVAIAKESDGLVLSDQEAASEVYMAVVLAVVTADSNTEAGNYRRKARARALSLNSQIGEMRALSVELEKEQCSLNFNFMIERRVSELISKASADLEQTIASMEELASVHKDVGLGGGGNVHHFTQAYVHSMRAVWLKITRKEPGICRRPVVNFAVAVGDALDLFDLRGRSPFDIMYERFDNIR